MYVRVHFNEKSILRRHIDTQHTDESLSVKSETPEQQQNSSLSESSNSINNGGKYGPIGCLIQELAARH